MKHKRLVYILLAMVVIIIALTIFYFKQAGAPGQKIAATITNIVDRPNRAEDGYFGIELQSSSGEKLTIDATGYMNVPAAPEYFGNSCITVPKIAVGDKIEFVLPKSESQENTYDVCYKKELTGYYINKL